MSTDDRGHETVGQALLITGIAVGALAAAQLSEFVLATCQTMITTLG